jgi:hypothetical protein
VEELEVDLDQVLVGHAHRFLESCGVGGDEIASLIARARVIASDYGVAVLAVKVAPGSVTAAVSAAPTVTLATALQLSAGVLSRRSVRAPTKTPSARPKSPTPA